MTILYIPNNLDFEAHNSQFHFSDYIKFDTTKPSSYNKVKDKLAFIIDSIINGMAVRKITEEEETIFIPLYSQILAELIGDNYTSYINYLLETGVIGINDSYSAGRYSKGYCLIESYLGTELKAHVISDSKLHKKYNTIM